MFKLVIPSAAELYSHAITNVQAMQFLQAAETICSCSFSHLWFYILDQRLDGEEEAAIRFLTSLEQAMHYDSSEPDSKVTAFFINHDKISSIVFKLAELMHFNLDNIIGTCPQLRNYSNSLSYLDYMDNRALVITFFNNIFEKEAYVNRISGS